MPSVRQNRQNGVVMNLVKIFFLATLALALPGFGMNHGDEIEHHAPKTEEEVFFTKRKITQENFDRAMQPIRHKTGGDYLFDKLSSKLKVCVNQELTADEWSKRVQEAYGEILAAQQKSVAAALRISCPLEEILVYTMYAMPN